MLCMRRCTNTLAKIIQPDHGIRRQNTDDPRREQLDTLRCTRGSTRANERPLSAPTRPVETGVDRCVRLSRTLLELSSRKCHTCTIMYHMSDSGDVTFINSVVGKEGHSRYQESRPKCVPGTCHIHEGFSILPNVCMFFSVVCLLESATVVLPCVVYVCWYIEWQYGSSIDVRDLDG